MDVIYRDTPIPALRERSGEQFFERRLMCGSFFCSRFGSSKLLLQLLVLAFEFSCHGAPEKGPPDFRLKHQVLHSHRQRTGQLSQLDQPTTQRAATNLEPSSQEDIFEAIKRSVVAELREGALKAGLVRGYRRQVLASRRILFAYRWARWQRRCEWTKRC